MLTMITRAAILGSFVFWTVPAVAAWELTHTLNNPDAAVEDRFGFSVAVSGNTALVGAYADDAGALNSGAAYLFDVTTGKLLHTLKNPAPAVEDRFGYSVSISGNTALVGASFDDSGTLDSGAAYLFDVATGDLLHTLNNPTPAASDRFGSSVSISGNTTLVGASGDDSGTLDSGAAYLFDVATGDLLHTLNNPTPGYLDIFGFAVSVSGNLALVGGPNDDAGYGYIVDDAGSAYIFDVTTGNLLRTLKNPTPANHDRFGISVSVSGNIALVGAFSDDTGALNSGAAYLFDVTTGDLLHTLNNPEPAVSDHFGFSVSTTGNTALVSAWRDNAGGSDAGSAYLFDVITGNLLLTLNNPAPAADDGFGISVSVSGDTALVGARYDDTDALDAGAAYLFSTVPLPPALVLLLPGLVGLGLLSHRRQASR